MTVFMTNSDQQIEVYKIAVSMNEAGLSSSFISEAVKMALVYEGAFELMQLWAESTNSVEKDEIVADLQEESERINSAPSEPFNAPRINFDDLETSIEDIITFKRELRGIVDVWGGISKLSRVSGIPQPSLSRFFSSASLPRNTTVYRIVQALLPEPTTGGFKWTAPISIKEVTQMIWSKQQEERMSS